MGEEFGIDLIISVIKLCSICLEMCHKVSNGLVAIALDGNSLGVQQLELSIIFLGGSGVLNRLEYAVATEMFIHGEEIFGTCAHGL